MVQPARPSVSRCSQRASSRLASSPGFPPRPVVPLCLARWIGFKDSQGPASGVAMPRGIGTITMNRCRCVLLVLVRRPPVVSPESRRQMNEILSSMTGASSRIAALERQRQRTGSVLAIAPARNRGRYGVKAVGSPFNSGAMHQRSPPAPG